MGAFRSLFIAFAFKLYSYASLAEVTVLTDSNVNEVLYNDGAGVFVEFYAPWCGHCQQLTPIWDQLGAAFDEDSDVVIAKLDATKETEVAKKFEIKGYPTLLFFPQGDKTNPVKYQQARELENLVKFVNEQTNNARTADGSVDELGGRSKELDDALLKLISESCEGKPDAECVELISAAFFKQVENMRDENMGDQDTAKYYSKAYTKFSEQPSWASKEIDR